MKKLVLTIVVLGAGTGAASAQLTTPGDWRWRQDTPSTLVQGQDVPAGAWRFVGMPPGWHITTGPGVLLFPAADGTVSGNYALEAEVFLFPGESQEEYGIFIGGDKLDVAEPADYTAFVLRRDGHAAVLSRQAGKTVSAAEWARHEAVVPGAAGDDPVKNVLRVEIDAANATLTVNGTTVVTVPRQRLRTDGCFGFRVGKDMNLHVSTLDLTRRLAPPRPGR